MDLVLVRHALAAPKGKAAADAERPLTKEGRRLFRDGTVARMEAEGWSFDKILHSPWRRAAETAELMAGLSRRKPASLAELAAAPRAGGLSGLAGRRVAAVGHQPWLGELAALLCCGADGTGFAERLKIGKGAALWLRGELSPGGMQLRGLWPCSPGP